jgi:CheY-like chemotaxis protein
VLLVEDHHDVADASRHLMESLGCRVELAPSGEAAQALLAKASPPFDVLLSDIAMPGSISGIELARWVRDNYPHLPVVLMTGYTAELARAQELSYTVLQKPVSPQALGAALAKSLRRSS